MPRVEIGQRPSLEQLSKAFVPSRDILRKDLVDMQTRATHALLDHHQLGTSIRLGIALAVLAKEDALRKVNRLKKRNEPIDIRREIETFAQRDRSNPNFMRQDKGEYVRTLVANKMLFGHGPIPFEREVFDEVNNGLAYMNDQAKASLFWRTRMEEARNLTILYPDHRGELAVDGGFFDVLVDQFTAAEERGDGEEIASIAASMRILYPDRLAFNNYPETWKTMKEAHYRLSDLASKADPRTGLPYEYHLRLAQHDANMAIISARSITITPHAVSIVLAA